MVDEVGEGTSRHVVAAVRSIVAELVYQGVGLVRDTFAVAIHIEAREGSGFDAVAAELPHSIEHAVARTEAGRFVVEWHVHGYPDHIVRRQASPATFHLNIAEWHHLPHVVRHADGCSAGVASVLRDVGTIGVCAFAQRHDHHPIASGAARSPVHTAVADAFAQVKSERVACRERSCRYLNLSEGCPAEVGHDVAIGQHDKSAGGLARLFQHDGRHLCPCASGYQRDEKK